jgi:wobble nucleotide-excising tRNase
LKISFEKCLYGFEYNNQIIEFEDKVSNASKLVLNSWLKNLDLIEKKIQNPSLKISLEKSNALTQNYTKQVLLVNDFIQTHNKTVINYEAERELLIKQIWKFLLEELSDDINEASSKKSGIEKAISSLKGILSKRKLENQKLSQRNIELEQKIDSLKPTISEINKTLDKFGFHGFKIEEAAKSGYYKIARDDNSDARKTLSEGEKTFISFLYFYYRIKGIIKGEEVGGKKIIVIDDPISSLDNNVIFVVSSIIKALINQVCKDASSISQIFIMTHNIFFHKEVTYLKKGDSTANRKFLIVRKNNGVSYLQSFDENPVLSTYQMMWKELDIANTITVGNVMRRILETYFQHFGDTNLEDLPDEFSGDEKLICRSLISWIHDNSHNITDDIYYSLSEITMEKYKNVFRQIFDKKGHLPHYEMMKRSVSDKLTANG